MIVTYDVKIGSSCFVQSKYDFMIESSTTKVSNKMTIQVRRERKKRKGKERNIDLVRKPSKKDFINFNVTKNLPSVFPSCQHHRNEFFYMKEELG